MLRIFSIFVAINFCATTAISDTVPSPTDEVLLTITGEISVTNTEDALELDLDMLRELDDSIIETSTIWTDGVQRFQGVSLNALVEFLSVTDGVLKAQAINDYTVEIPVSDAIVDGPILAYTMNDAVMSVREKGPLWVVYPYDSGTQYQSEVIYSRSIWQLDRIEVVK